MINKETVFTEKQPEYRYCPLVDGTADKFIYKYKEEQTLKNDTGEESESGEQTVYVYEMHAFNAPKDEISENDVKADPMSYFGYEPLDRYEQQIIENLEIDYRLSCLELGL